MVKISIALGLGLMASLYGNYIYRKCVNDLIEISKRDTKKYKQEIEDINGTLEKKDGIIKKQDNALKEYRKTNENLKILLDDNKKQYENLKVSHEGETKKSKKYLGKYYEFYNKYNTQLNNNEGLVEYFKKKEIELYNLDWAYDELMKAYNSNALDLYFWNLLPKADRETRRRFINKGQYKVYSLEDGRLAFEVV